MAMREDFVKLIAGGQFGPKFCWAATVRTLQHLILQFSAQRFALSPT